MTPEPPRLFVSLGSGGANSGGGAANGENFSVHKVSPKGTRLFADPGLAAPGRFVGRASCVSSNAIQRARRVRGRTTTSRVRVFVLAPASLTFLRTAEVFVFVLRRRR